MAGHLETAAPEIIPAGTAAALRPHLRGIAEEMAREIQQRVPEYARPHDSTYARLVQLGSERTLDDFLAAVAGRASSGSPDAEPVTEVFRRLGRSEARCDRSLDVLQNAMHIGAEVIWRRLSQACLQLGVGTDRLCRLAEALLSHFRENASAAADGYVEVRARLSGELQRRQRHLLELVLSDPPVSPAAIGKVARAASWRIPEQVSVVILRDADDAAPFDLPPDVLVDLSRSEPCLVVPDGNGAARRRTLELALRGWTAAVGPPLPLPEAATSLRWARQVAALAERGLIRGPDVIHCVDHMASLVILQNEELIGILATLRLAPLAGLRPIQRDRLIGTLRAWLDAGGDATEVAARLHVHPQTVRYRIRHLQELFGGRLRDPDLRLELDMVLRARALAAPLTS